MTPFAGASEVGGDVSGATGAAGTITLAALPAALLAFLVVLPCPMIGLLPSRVSLTQLNPIDV